MMINLIIDYGGGGDRDNQDNAVIMIFLQAPILKRESQTDGALIMIVFYCIQ